MKCCATSLADVVVIEGVKHGDHRGFFMELYHREKFQKLGIEEEFVQDNLSSSRKGILRGLHYQCPRSQGKLVAVVRGSIFDVAVDVRRGSPTFGQWTGVELSADNGKQIWIPPGFAHGFCVTSEEAVALYKCTDLYAPDCEHTVLWSDPDIGIDWPCAAPIISGKDAEGVRLAQLPTDVLPVFAEI